MDIIALHQQSKYDKQKKNKTALTQCIVELLRDGDVVGLRGAFTLNYDLYNKPRHIVFHHTIEINMKSGDIETLYEIENVNLDALDKLEADGLKVFPSPTTLRLIQNKGNQKDFYVANSIPTSKHTRFSNLENLKAAIETKVEATELLKKICN
jgi:glutathione synthase/RimK-type ligase-like ATP-grasp enzyme